MELVASQMAANMPQMAGNMTDAQFAQQLGDAARETATKLMNTLQEKFGALLQEVPNSRGLTVPDSPSLGSGYAQNPVAKAAAEAQQAFNSSQPGLKRN